MMSDKEKVQVYEELLHRVQLYAEVTMNTQGINKLIDNICRWSYAHRAGNGSLSEEEIQERIDNAFTKLLER